MNEIKRLDIKEIKIFLEEFIAQSQFYKTEAKSLKHSGEIAILTGYRECFNDMIHFLENYEEMAERRAVIIEKFNNLGD